MNREKYVDNHILDCELQGVAEQVLIQKVVDELKKFAEEHGMETWTHYPTAAFKTGDVVSAFDHYYQLWIGGYAIVKVKIRRPWLLRRSWKITVHSKMNKFNKHVPELQQRLNEALIG